MTAKKVKVTENGPYIIKGNIPLAKETSVVGQDNEPESWKKSGEFTLQETYAFCRCGKSGNKPFCDGTHLKTGFNGKEKAARKTHNEMAERTVGPDLELADAECYCSIARFCHRAGDTWTLTENSQDPKNKKIAIEEACNCPSGRLVAYDKTTKQPIEPSFEPSISVTEDGKHNVSGPLWVKGGIEIESADGYIYEKRNRVTLCRCGMSSNKPFCNGSHIKGKFKA